MSGDRPASSTMQRALAWVDQRLPLSAWWRQHLSGYYVPKNLNFWYCFGALALLALAIQVFSGVFLLMHYKPDATLNAAGIPVAFASIVHLMREVPGGAIVRDVHAVGASLLFGVVFLHLFRGLLYGGYRKPRELVWLLGVAILVGVMAEAFCGYLLPWGQASFWSARVVVNLVETVPGVGPDLAFLIRGGSRLADASLGHFFALHVVVIPLGLLGLLALHLIALRTVGSGNPDGVDLLLQPDACGGLPPHCIPFHPYYTVKDWFAASLFLFGFAAIVLFVPEGGGYFPPPDNAVPADALRTPERFGPLWYFTPFYAMLRATTPDFLPALWGLIVLIAGLRWRGLACGRPRWVCLGGVVLAYWGFFGLRLPGWTPLFPGGLAGVVGQGLGIGFWGLGVVAAAMLALVWLPWLDRSPVRSIRSKGWLAKTVLGLFVLAFLTLGWLGTQPFSPSGKLLAQICTLLYLAYFGLMPWHSRLDKARIEAARLIR